MKNRSLKVFIIVAALTASVLLVSFFAYKNWHEKNVPYEMGYVEKLGLEYYYYSDKLFDILGESVYTREEVVHDASDVFYYLRKDFEGYKLYFEYDEDEDGRKPKDYSEYQLNSAHITDPEYRIGKYHIGIGSDRALVEKAYKGKKRLADGEFGFIDGTIWVRFLFDSEDKVKEIVFTTGGP
ncbi:MAG: hypothetical protein FWG00_06200 [Coriobacteriia bacterium]|nr:hypothetical protein [Coriobacteriia bacterium]